MTPRILLDAVEAVGRIADGGTATVPVSGPADEELLRQWCEARGHQLVDSPEGAGAAVVRRGRPPDPLASLPEDRRPGHRLWLYSNFDCNLACDYCCVASSPRTARRFLGVETTSRLADEAPAAGVRELYLTGGEPFLLPEIDRIVGACASALPTTVLTNGMLFRGHRLDLLDRLPRDGVVLQISLDSATPALHDRHRGRGSHGRALAGVRTALDLGFRVRLAATLDADQRGEEQALHRLGEDLGVGPEDRVIRRVAQQGVADHGLVVSRRSLVPEVCVTASGVYWHPVAATDPDMLVRQDPFPLRDAIDQVTAEFAEHRRRAGELATTFPCA